MTASDLRFAHRATGWYIVNVTTAATVAGPFASAFDAIEARNKLARVDLTATMTTARRTAQAYGKELEVVSNGR